MDPRTKGTVRRVLADSPADRDGFQAADEIVSLSGQPLLSLADVQWVLHNAPAEGKLAAEVRRDGRTIPLELTLAEGWRSRDNLSWRATSWSLRRMTTGGLLLEELPKDARTSAGLPGDSMALRVRHVGQYGPHALAKRAGFQQGDIIVSVADRQGAMRETDLFAWLVNQPIGKQIPVTVLRDGKQIELTLTTQE
jgi:S1-C subfamily serine protease